MAAEDMPDDTAGDRDGAARAALKARQGKGARYDAARAPAEDLLLARRGTAYFARKLMELPDADLSGPSALPGLTRAHVVARVSYAARHEALALEALAGGDEGSGVGAIPQLPEALPSPDLAATLPARALRHLFHHSAVHLNVCWRDLTDADWDRQITLPDGSITTPRTLPRRRARHIWQAAIDLANGARPQDIPKYLRNA
ncbi:maleylpyruvate isomerase N-terminal domain-containing protein [Celeribacter indicus]|uniref:Mycothiol-dependent maleylpyruvate isomerase metal-binding domain-containing protein n=2 Tax=Celeribacter indicus TaxID=1208324 RepID=A0A0B5DNU4_9RHOB|nr:maleylpyruvate isomerase N-terminal domain-containing protein [Celeribacter indicus]AJE44889.1 hypothetical protein P73_0174 [Celeribacter indicus]